MAKLEFDDELSRIVEVFNSSAGARTRRAGILKALNLRKGERVLDVGSGPGNQAFDMSPVVGKTGHVNGVDSAVGAVEIARNRCSELGNTTFEFGEASSLPFDDSTFDAVMSSQVFEYLEDVPGALAEIYRVLKPGGRVLIHDTDWGATLWHSGNPDRMTKIMKIWDLHLVDPHLPRTLGRKLANAGFQGTKVDPLIQIETKYDPTSFSAVLMDFIEGYVVSQNISLSEAKAWADDLKAQDLSGDYFYSSNEYIFTAHKP